MTNKEKILIQLGKESLKLDGQANVGITANDISTILGIKRNIVSQYLNELHREEKVIKINTRPVYFIDKKIYDKDNTRFKLANKFINTNIIYEEAQSDNVFSNLVGYNGSLKSVVEQCKAATNYPTNGLSILLVGESGVGKSFIAQLIFDYAKSQNIIDENSSFIIFNCAEYANNPELLSSALFGSSKGAYTGADSDKVGLIEEANGGYLFLDEIHRLSCEGQEKLFIFLDKGVFRRVGESGKWRNSNVRIVFATTEDPEEFFLKTFLRRIPLITKIPSFNDRPLMEKLELIKNIYRKEAISINKEILLEENVIRIIIEGKWSGNIGKLINTIKITCANAFTEGKNKDEIKLKIKVSHLPKDIIENFNSDLFSKDKTILIGRNENDKVRDNSLYKGINNINKEFIDNVIGFRNKKISEEDFFENIRKSGNLLTDYVYENKLYNFSEGTVEVIRKIITNKLGIFRENCGIKWRNQTIEIITNSIYSLPIFDNYEENKTKEVMDFLRLKYNKLYKLSEEIVKDIESTINIKLNNILLSYITTNLALINKDLEWNLINGVIIAHGKSTASSIASVANNMLGMYIYDYMDMPIDVSTEEITKKLREYIKNIDSKLGLILLVDMGSLQEIYLGIKDDFNGDIAIINNLSSLLALDVGNKIINRKPIREIIKESVENNVCKYNYIPATSKKKDAIITTCSTGIGTAEKIKNLLEQCIKEKDITILAYDYNKLKDEGENGCIFNEYKVRLIIGLNNPCIENIPYLSLEDMIMQKDKVKVLSILRNIFDEDTMEEINTTLLKVFTINNVINHLIILNPDKILTQVQEAISTLEYNLKLKFPNSLKIGIYIHISCMMERLVIREPLVEYKNIEAFMQCNRHFIKEFKKSFSVMENFYKVEIPVSEIAYIYDTISRKIKIE